VDIYSTANVPRSTCANYWNEVYSSKFARVTFNPMDREGFAAELKVGSVGELGIARFNSEATDIERTRSHIAQSRRHLFAFVLQLRGRGTFSHYGHETTLEEGDFTLCDNAAPHRLRLSGPCEYIFLRTTADDLKSYFPFPERVCGMRLPARQGFTNAAAQITQSLWIQVERGLPEKFNSMVARNVMDVLATSYAILFDPWIADTSAVVARRMEAKRFIEAHLKDPDLAPRAIAAALRLSPRYLRTLFSGDHETVSAYILRRRLEECARQIASPLWRGRTLTDIAFMWGFNSAAHFTRVFRDQYGMTPRHYRDAHVDKKTALS
jgi:AraC family transcriptional activator of tynA and feaB